MTGVFSQTLPVSNKTAHRDFPFVLGLALISEKIEGFFIYLVKGHLVSLQRNPKKQCLGLVLHCRLQDLDSTQMNKIALFVSFLSSDPVSQSILMPKHLHFFSNLNSKWQVTRKVILLFCKALNYTLCCNEIQHQIHSSHWDQSRLLKSGKGKQSL